MLLGGTEGFDSLFTTANGCVTGSLFDRESARIIARSAYQREAFCCGTASRAPHSEQKFDGGAQDFPHSGQSKCASS